MARTVSPETSEVKGDDRVSVETAMHELFRELTERSNENPEVAPFVLMKDVSMWTVALGVRTGRRLPLSGAKTQIFRWDQLSQDLDVPVLKALAVAETGEVEGVLHEDRVLRITEEYANSGIRELKEALLNQPGQPLWNLVAIVRRNNGAYQSTRLPVILLVVLLSIENISKL